MASRKLKHHEKRLLKKVDFFQWKSDKNLREVQVLRRYLIQDREDYVKYNKLVGLVTRISRKLRKLNADSKFRIQTTDALLDKLYTMGLVDQTKSLSKADKVSVSAFCRRRLSTVLVRLKMAENMKAAVTLIEGGHVRVGPEVVTDPAYMVTRLLEDYVTWVDTSKIKRTVQKYNDKLDDFDLLGE